MKYIALVVLFLGIVASQGFPPVDPATSGCKATQWCVGKGEGCNITFPAKYYCDSLSNLYCSGSPAKCLEATQSEGEPCNITMFCKFTDGLTCSNFVANGTCEKVKVPTPKYQGESCDNQNFCYSGLTCVSGKCEKNWLLGLDAACTVSDECAPGHFCKSGKCAKWEKTPLSACDKNADCGTDNQVCLCFKADVSTGGKCIPQGGVPADLCKDETKAFLDGGNITASNKLDSEYKCMLECLNSNLNEAMKAFAGTNVVNTAGCKWTDVKKCTAGSGGSGSGAATGAATAAATAGSPASTIVASFALVVIAIIVALF